MNVSIITIETPTLGDRTYLAHDGHVAVVVDPQRDIDRVLAVADEAGVQITHVLETHVHNDYVTGGLALAEATGAVYALNRDDEVGFERLGLRDDDVIDVSARTRLRAIATPGHTFTHLSYALESREDDGAWAADAVFTGGSLLFGATGRPDLLGVDHTEVLAHRQHTSVHRLVDGLPDTTAVLPTHGFGSFCSTGSTGSATSSTIGRERRTNPAMTQDRVRWVADVLAGLDAYPAYYAHMAPANSRGPSAVDLGAPRPADRSAVAGRITAGDWVVDLRGRAAFADAHVVGTVNIGLDGQFSTYLGWLVPWGASLTLLGDTAEQVAEAQRELVRIGIDRIDGAATGEPSQWSDRALGSFRRAAFTDLAAVRRHRHVTVLDVRLAGEFASSHVDGALNLPLHELSEHLDDIPAGEVWVHCASGYRASVAASILATREIQVVVVDGSFDEQAADAGLPLTDGAVETTSHRA